MTLREYLDYLNEQFGIPPQRPVQKPRGSRPKTPRMAQPKIPKVPVAPVNPQMKKQRMLPKRTMDQIKNQNFKKQRKIF